MADPVTEEPLPEEEEQETVETEKITYTHPLVQHSDMPEDMRQETVDLCVMACEKFPNNNEKAARQIKETMDRKYGQAWHCVVGESYAIEITHEAKNLLYTFYGGNLAVCVWKCT